MARRGAQQLWRGDEDRVDRASGGRRGDEAGAVGAGPARSPRPGPSAAGHAPAPRPSTSTAWVRDDGALSEWADTAPTPAAARGGAGGKGPRSGAGARTSQAVTGLGERHAALPPEVATAIRHAALGATAVHREHLVERAESAAGAFGRGRFLDALRAVKPVADEVPEVAAVRELAGLSAYRAGRWREALRHLRAFGELTGSAEHLPVLMDCQRALHRPQKVVELWGELRQSSPDADVLAEGRIVAAASLAESGDLNGAITLLANAGASKALRNPSERHLRQWYVLADLHERAGDVPRAREYFERVLRAEPGAYDVAERIRALGPERRPGRTRAGTRGGTPAGVRPPAPARRPRPAAPG